MPGTRRMHSPKGRPKSFGKHLGRAPQPPAPGLSSSSGTSQPRGPRRQGHLLQTWRFLHSHLGSVSPLPVSAGITILVVTTELGITNSIKTQSLMAA